MKSIWYSFLFLFTAGHSFAQAPVSDTSETLSIRGHDPHFYIDGIRVRGNANLPKTAIEEVTVITGGLPVNYGDINSSVIWINKSPAPAIPRKVIVSDKEQKMATE